MLLGISLFSDERIARGRQQLHRHGSGGAGLGHRFGNVLGFLECAADEDARPGGRQGGEPVGVAEAKVVQFYLEAGSAPGHGIGRFHAHGQDDQVKILLLKPAVSIQKMNAQVFAAGDLNNPRRNAFDVVDVLLRPGPLVVLVKIFAVGADIHVKDGRVQALDVIARNHGLFGRHHAADRGTIVIAASRITRTDALNPGDAPGLPAIGEADDMSLEGPRGREHALELNAGDDVGIAAITELAFSFGIELSKARGQDDCAHLQGDRPLPSSRGRWRAAGRSRRNDCTPSTGRS